MFRQMVTFQSLKRAVHDRLAGSFSSFQPETLIRPSKTVISFALIIALLAPHALQAMDETDAPKSNGLHPKLSEEVKSLLPDSKGIPAPDLDLEKKEPVENGHKTSESEKTNSSGSESGSLSSSPEKSGAISRTTTTTESDEMRSCGSESRESLSSSPETPLGYSRSPSSSEEEHRNSLKKLPEKGSRKTGELEEKDLDPGLESGSGGSSPEKHFPREKEDFDPLSEKKEKDRTSKERSSATSVPNGYDEARSIYILKGDKDSRDTEDELPVPEIGSLPSEGQMEYGSWPRYPHQPMVPIRSTANGSIQVGPNLNEHEPLLKHSKGSNSHRRDTREIGTYIEVESLPISRKESSKKVRHRNGLKHGQRSSESKPFFPQGKIYVFRGEIPELFDFLEHDPSQLPETLRSYEDLLPPHDLRKSPSQLESFLEEDPQSPKRLDPSILSNVEEGKILRLNPRGVRAFKEEIGKLPPPVKALLSGAAYQDIEQHSSKTDWLAIGLGTFIGAGLVVAMVPVYNGGLIYMRDHHNWNFVNDIQGSPSSPAYVSPSLWYILITLAPDAISRNVNLFKRAFRHLKEETGYVLRTLGIGAAVFLPSLTELGYLIVNEIHDMDEEHIHGVNNQFAISMMILGPFLVADSMAGNFETAWEFCEDIQGWAKKSTSYYASLFPRSWLPDFEDPLVEKFQGNFKKLTHFFRWCPEDQLNEIYDNTFETLQSASSQFPELKGNDLDAAKAFCVMNYLLSIGDQLEKGIERAKSWYESISEMAIFGTLTLGSVYRVLVPQLIVKTLAGIFFSKAVSGGIGWGGAGLGFLFQTALEYKGMKNLAKEVVWEEEPTGHSSHSHVRKGFKAGALWQALVFTVPLFVLCYQATDIWFGNDWFMVMSIPFLLGEFATLANQFNNSYNRKVATAATKVVHKVATCAKCSKPQLCTDCKRDRLIRLSHKLNKKVPNISPELRQKIQSSFNQEHGLDIHEEEY